jgi:hypothetical protein
VKIFLLVSRSDSALRPGITRWKSMLAADELSPFDARFLIACNAHFFEGESTFLIDSIHYLKVNGIITPVHRMNLPRLGVSLQP